MADGQLLRDLRLELRQAAFRPVYGLKAAERRAVTRQGPRRVIDFPTVDGTDNLAQAVMMRLLTPRGELAALGHPTYGSHLHELVGRENTVTTRNLVRLTTLESLEAEPRIAKVVEVTVTPSPGTRDRVDVLVRAQPIQATDVVSVGPFTLEL